MSDLTHREKLKLEKFFEMGGGYVFDFSNRTLNDFVFEILDMDLYSDRGDSKANRLKTIWQKEINASQKPFNYITNKGCNRRVYK